MRPFLLPLFILLISLFFIISYSQDPQNLCNPHDKNVLLSIKNYWGNPTSLDHWNPNVDCCEWYLIICNDHGNVKRLEINYAPDIHGSLPPWLDQLPYLTELKFNSMFNITKPIPSYIGKLTNLTVLIISGTYVRGPIPNFLAHLTNLIELDLSRNKHTGPIPDFMGRLKSLAFLSLYLNQLTGPIPKSIAQLPNLISVFIGNNKLSGPIPEFLVQSKLDLLDVQSNYLSGPIPASIGLLPKLQSLHLEDNRLNGMIPKSFGSTKILYSISLQNNRITGDASFLFGKGNTQMGYINVSNNRLKFDFTKVDLGQNLTYVDISHNMIYGSLPFRFGWLDSKNFNVSYNQLCGPIPNGRRFKNVDTSIFDNNKCLCGGPYRGCK